MRRLGHGLTFDQCRRTDKRLQQPWRSLRAADKRGRQHGLIRGGQQRWQRQARHGPLRAVLTCLLGSAVVGWLQQLSQPCGQLLKHAADRSSEEGGRFQGKGAEASQPPPERSSGCHIHRECCLGVCVKSTCICAHRLWEQHCGVQCKQAQLRRPGRLQRCTEHRILPQSRLSVLQDSCPVQGMQQCQRSPVGDEQTRPCASTQCSAFAVHWSECIQARASQHIRGSGPAFVQTLAVGMVVKESSQTPRHKICGRWGCTRRPASADGAAVWKVALSQGRLLQ